MKLLQNQRTKLSNSGSHVMSVALISQLAREIIRKEAAALLTLSQVLTDDLAVVVEWISALSGRVILTGVGKSSHIAKKVASTLSSTGTPSTFIHPTEASHGDLGMITKDDLVIAFSRSGESVELRDIIAFCKRLSIPLIGVTAITDSTLAKAANLNLFIPELNEACTIGLAPTTSSIMMLALGDALAVACLEMKKFTKNDFKILHPAGKIGLSLLRVVEIMHGGDEIPLVDSSASVSEAILEMTRCRFGCVGVINNSSHLIGIFTDGDLRRNLSSVDLSSHVVELMTRDPQVIGADTYAMDVVNIFREKRIPSIFICKDKMPIGILHLHDLLQKGLL